MSSNYHSNELTLGRISCLKSCLGELKVGGDFIEHSWANHSKCKTVKQRPDKMIGYSKYAVSAAESLCTSSDLSFRVLPHHALSTSAILRQIV